MSRWDHVKGFIMLALASFVFAMIADRLAPSFVAVMAALMSLAMFCGACVALWAVFFGSKS